MKSIRKAPAPVEPAAPPLLLAAWLPYRLFLVAGRVAQVLADFYGPRFGLNQTAWRILAVIANRPGASAQEIGRACALDQVAISRGVALLVDKGLARRRSAANDRRYASITLTDAGRSAFAEIAALCRDAEEKLLHALDDKQRAVLDDALARLDLASAQIETSGWRGLVEERSRR